MNRLLEQKINKSKHHLPSNIIKNAWSMLLLKIISTKPIFTLIEPEIRYKDTKSHRKIDDVMNNGNFS